MKKWFKNIKRSGLILIALVVITTGVVYATISEVVKDFTASVTLAQATTLADSSLGIYSDANCTTPLTAVNFGTVAGFRYDIGQGTGATEPELVPVYIRNQHTESLLVGINAPFAQGTVSLVSSTGAALYTSARTLAPSAILPARLKLTLNSTYTAGAHSFTIHFVGQTLETPLVPPTTTPTPTPTTTAPTTPAPTTPNITGIGGFGSPIVLGATMTYTINGDHFVSGITASISGPGTTVTATRFISSTQIEVDIVYSAAASDSSQTLTVTNPGNLTDTYTYTVGTLVFTPNIASIGGFGSPIVLGATMTYTVNGDHFMSGIAASISGPGTTVTATRYISSTQIEVDIVYSAAASDSSQTLTVTNPGNLTDTYTYTVGTLVFTPNITSIGGFSNPIVLGATMTYTVNGDSFMSGIAASISGPGTTVTATRFISSTQIEVDIVYSAAASNSSQTLTVTNPGNLTDTYTYTVGTL